MSLLSLPPELVVRVSSSLTTSELGNLRRTCKHVESDLFDSFAREFFTKKQFMLEQISLQALIDISNHPTLSSRVREVVIGLQIFPPDHDLMTTFAKQRYQTGHVEHNVLVSTGMAASMLSEAFSRLPHLRTISLRDYNARGRYRDGDSAAWNSWGWSFGSPDTTTPRSLITIPPEPILPLLFYALGCAQSHVQHVHVFLRKHQKLTPFSFNVVDGFMGEKVRPILLDLKELMLAISPNALADYGKPWGSFDPNLAIDAPLKRLLHFTPALETLRLNFEPHQFYGARFLDWLGTTCPATTSPTPPLSPQLVVPPLSLHCLTTLELGMLNVPAHILVKVLVKFDPESLSLWKCTLHSAPKTSVVSWTSFLHDLSVALPDSTRLKSVLIGYPSQRCFIDDRDFYAETPVFYSPSDVPGDSNIREMRYRHSVESIGIREWLEQVSKRVVIEDLDESSDSEEDVDEDDEAGDDDEDEVDEDDEDEDEDED